MNNHCNSDVSRTLLLCLSEAARIDAQIVEEWGVEASSREETNKLGITLFIQCCQHGLASPNPDAGTWLSREEPPPASKETLTALSKAAGLLGPETFEAILKCLGENETTLEASEDVAHRVLQACRQAWRDQQAGRDTR